MPESRPNILFVFTDDQWRRFRWGYAWLVERADGILARILLSLETRGHRENTVVVFASDHGDGNGAQRWNQKQMLYDESIHVPLIVADPRTPTRRGQPDDRLVSTGLDLMPTFCQSDQADAAAPGRDHVVVETKFGVHSRPFGIGGRCVISPRYKYSFDLQADPGEMHELRDDPRHAQAITQHRRWLQAWANDTNDPFPLIAP